MLGKYCFIIFSILRFSRVVSDPIVNCPSGMVEGIYYKTWSGRVIRAFLGIPYAIPLKPNTRFENAVLMTRWENTCPAKQFGNKCIQISGQHKRDRLTIEGSDDCLTLNIFTPKVSNTSKLEVIFFIHGGGFMKGSGDMYTPDFIMDRHDVVFVTINYRLGPLGFLSTEDDVIPGNFGLKDQVVALKWVRRNIDSFGGDKNKITLMGEDAGAASVHLHYLSPLSRHLFKHGISLGGSAFCPWALTKNPRSKATQLALAMQIENTTSEEIFKSFQMYPHQFMMDKVHSVFELWDHLPFSPFGPVIEKKTGTAFLSEHPHKIIEEKKFKDAPWLVGLTTHEGLYPGAKFARRHDRMEELEERWNEIAPMLLDYKHTVPRDMLETVNEKIRQYYFEDEEISVNLRRQFVRMMGDRFFVADTERALRLQASHAVNYTFLYRFGYRGRYSKAHSLCDCSENLGVSHGDDLLYLFNHPEYNVTDNSYGVKMMRQMVDIIISFLKRGIPKTDPDSIWRPVKRGSDTGHNIEYMEILTSQSLHLRDAPDIGNYRFWNNLHLAELKNVVGDHKKFYDEL